MFPSLFTHIKYNFRDFHLVEVTLPKPLASNKTLNLVLETVQTHATTPWPATAGQSEDQALKYTTGLFVLSPYATAIQRTKLKYNKRSLSLSLLLTIGCRPLVEHWPQK